MKITFGHRHEVEQRKFKIFSGLLPIRAGLLHLYIVEREMFSMNLYPCNPCHPWSSPCGLLWALRVSAVHPRAVPGFGGWPAAGTISDRFSPRFPHQTLANTALSQNRVPPGAARERREAHSAAKPQPRPAEDFNR